MSDTAAETVIDVDDLSKTYGETVAVDSLTFEVHDGEIFALLGPNGAGKTTTVEILEGLRTPTSGSATVLGFDIATETAAVKERIGVVPQSFHTFDRLTVRENVQLIGDMYPDALATQDVLERLDLTEYAETRFAALSGGYQRRTGIAMALVGDPDILFLDEPTTGLDPAARRTTWTQIEHLAALGTTVVLTSHYMDEVEILADRAAILVDGSIVAVDTISALVEQYGGTLKLVVSQRQASQRSSVEIEAVLEEASETVYTNENGDLVGTFADRPTAQDTFSRLHAIEGDHSIELITAGMEDVFLEISGATLDERGNLA